MHITRHLTPMTPAPIRSLQPDRPEKQEPKLEPLFPAPDAVDGFVGGMAGAALGLGLTGSLLWACAGGLLGCAFAVGIVHCASRAMDGFYAPPEENQPKP